MDNKKKTMYEILEVSPTASYADIKASHKRLSLQLMSGELGLSREDIDFQLNVLDVALHTLSVPVSRDAYDALQESTTAPGNAVLPIKANVLSLVDDVKTRKIADEIEDNHRFATSLMARPEFPMEVVSSTVSASARSLKIILRTVIGLMVLGSILAAGRMAFASRSGGLPPREVAKAEEKLIIQEYYKKYGVRPASRAEAEFLEQENRRKENEQHAAEFAEKKREDEYRRFVDDSRRTGERIHDNLVRDEERARYEEMRRQEEKRYQEEAAQEEERMRIENERRKFGIN